MARTLFRILIFILVALLVLIATLWGALALWFRFPLPETPRLILALLFSAIGLWATVSLFAGSRRAPFLVFGVGLLGVVAWWATILPPETGDWSPDVARQVTGTVEGNILTLENVRDFEWHSLHDATDRWETRSYDLDTLETTDLFMSYWSGPAIAHMVISFGFADGEYLAWSVEVRRTLGSAYSPVADFFKNQNLVIIAASERDVIGTRTNIRGEDVQLYRLDTDPQAARELLLQYVKDSNALADQPVFYNSIFTNCTTVVFEMIHSLTKTYPLNWRIVVNGYLPEYIYAQGVVDTQIPFEELREMSHIVPKALAVGLTPEYSSAIRVGVPTPLN